jgi:hypothetical protein
MWQLVILALTAATVITIAIVKKKRMKATCGFFKFAFSVEASDDHKPDE